MNENPFKILEDRLQKIEDLLKKTMFENVSKQVEKEPEYLNLEQAANFLLLAKSTVYSYCSTGRLPFIKKHSKLYFKKSELENWLNSGAKNSNAEIASTINNLIFKGGDNEI